MRTARALILLAAAIGWSACSGKPGGGALRVVVGFGAHSKAQCVKVSVTTSQGTTKVTQAIARAERSRLVVGIERGGDLAGTVTVQALGYVDTTCSDAALNEKSDAPSEDLTVNGVHEVTLTLDGPAPADDADSDGYAKGVDCNDGSAAIHPGQKESFCSNGVDDDCDQQVDCADSDCALQPCDDGNACSSNDVCQNGACAGSQQACTNPGPCEQAPGSCSIGSCVYPADLGAACGDGGVCRSDKSCGPPGEVLCFDGLDNDNDTLTDCADPDCANQTCDGGTVTCESSFRCAGASCAGQPVLCNPPTNSCLTNGHCVEGVGCEYDAGVVGSACPNADSCLADGGCVTPEGGASCANGLDDDLDGLTDCADPGCDLQLCDDNNTCTSMTTCAGNSCGGGMTMICTPPSECFGASCQSGVGCVYPVRAGPCDGGVCQADGGCAPLAVFPYVPSNFDPNLLANVDAGVNLNCNATLDTSAANHFPVWCNAVPPAFVVSQADGGDALLVGASSFTLQGGRTLTVVGSRPLILGVTGDATLSGDLLVWNSGTVAPAGGSSSTAVPAWCAGLAGDPGGPGSTTNGGGGGGSFGTQGTPGSAGANGSNNAGGNAGANTVAPASTPLRGGCPGGNGGSSATNGGFGGGALQLSVGGLLTTSGRISVPGGGGKGGTTSQATCGGGGGGSGGMILLETWNANFTVTSFATAQGGGGGEGAHIGAVAGADAENGHTADFFRASGGNNNTVIGADGADAQTVLFGANPAGSTGGSGGCGGGGSGGLGLVLVNHHGPQCSAAGSSSPAPVFNPPSCP